MRKAATYCANSDFAQVQPSAESETHITTAARTTCVCMVCGVAMLLRAGTAAPYTQIHIYCRLSFRSEEDMCVNFYDRSKWFGHHHHVHHAQRIHIWSFGDTHTHTHTHKQTLANKCAFLASGRHVKRVLAHFAQNNIAQPNNQKKRKHDGGVHSHFCFLDAKSRSERARRTFFKYSSPRATLKSISIPLALLQCS